MSRLTKLIREHAPSGVPFRELGRVGTIFRGKRFVKDDMLNAGVPCLHYGEIYKHYGVAASKSISYVSADRARTLRFAQPGDVIIASAGETVEDIGKSVAWLGDEPIAIHDACYSFSSPLDSKYVSHYFSSRTFRDQIRQRISSSKVSSISTRNVSKSLIPVPHIEIQREIVHILDEFAQLEAELEAELRAELVARRHQYEHYRDELLNFRNARDVQRIPMGELGTIYGGLTGKSKADFSNGNSRFISYTNIYNNLAVDLDRDDRVHIHSSEKQRAVSLGDILFTGSSESPAEVAMSSVVTSEPQEPTYLNSFSIGFRPVNTGLLNPEFSKHLFRSPELRGQLMGTASGVTRFNVSKVRLAKVLVPVPPLDHQSLVAATLDDLQASMNDLSAGLSVELAARRKQYEYYRDKLFVFEEARA